MTNSQFARARNRSHPYGPGFLGRSTLSKIEQKAQYIYIADTRISIGCLSSQRLSTLNAIMPSSMGN